MPRPAEHAVYGERILQFGCDKGRDVWELQIKLIGWGSGSDNDGIGHAMDPVRVTGTFDATTRDAVMRFQKAHKLPVNGIVDAAVFRTIDREAAQHPVMVHHLRCPCVHGANDSPIVCRCTKHPEEGKCTGFGKKRFKDKYLLDGKKLADGTDISGEKLDLYDMYEYDGVDKALLWAVRAVMHRAKAKKIKVTAGYRCWHDNYHHTDNTRWHHRRSTFHFGKAIEFYHDGTCTEIGKDPTKDPCDECERIRKEAQAKCGFQLRWHEPNRMSVAEGAKKARPPTTPFQVHLDTVRRLEREEDEFVKTHVDGVQPLFTGTVGGVSFPLDLGDGLDPRTVPSEPFFRNTETGKGGWFPLGRNRLWHSGIHLFAGEDTKVHALFDGQIVACRAGDAAAQPYGSRNFVLIKHTWPTTDIPFYSLYLHLDDGAAAADAEIGWRRQLHLQTVDHVEALAPSPFFELKDDPDDATKKRLVAVGSDPTKPEERGGLAVGERAATVGGAVDADTLNLKDKAPANSQVVKLADPADTYVFTKLEDKDVGELYAKDDALGTNLQQKKAVGLKQPIPVYAGDVIGKIAKAPTDATLKVHGTFVHLETFSEEALLSGAGYETLDVADAAKAVDREAVATALLDKKLLPAPTDGVLLDADLPNLGQHPNRGLLRSALLTMPSTWSIDWKDTLGKAPGFSFMKDDARNTLGDAFNEYSWWDDVKADAGLPDAKVVHYHPIVLLLQRAFAPPA